MTQQFFGQSGPSELIETTKGNFTCKDGVFGDIIRMHNVGYIHFTGRVCFLEC